MGELSRLRRYQLLDERTFMGVGFGLMTKDSESVPEVQHHAGIAHHSKQPLGALALAALGIVYGDIGTSPLYALRECFHGPHAMEPTPDRILGVLSMILWSLIITISIKYMLFVLRADNRGEGGIL